MCLLSQIIALFKSRKRVGPPHLYRLGQLGEFEQGSNTDSERESNTDNTFVC